MLYFPAPVGMRVGRPLIVRGPRGVGDAVRAAVDEARAGLDRQRAAAVRRPARGGVVLDVAVARQVHGRDAVDGDADPGAAEPAVAVRVGGAAGLAGRAGGAALVHATGAGRAGDAGPRAVAGRAPGATSRSRRRPRRRWSRRPTCGRRRRRRRSRRYRRRWSGRPCSRCARRSRRRPAVHCPRVPTPPQVMQVPVQALSQQTPSTQKPLWQSPARAAGGAVRLLRHADPRRAEVAGRAVGVRRCRSSRRPSRRRCTGRRKRWWPPGRCPRRRRFAAGVSVEPLHVSLVQPVPAR